MTGFSQEFEAAMERVRRVRAQGAPKEESMEVRPLLRRSGLRSAFAIGLLGAIHFRRTKSEDQ